MRFEEAVYADGFERGKQFELRSDFEPLILTLNRSQAKVLRSAMESLPILSSDYAGLALTTAQRQVEQELLDKFQLILNGKVKGWYFLGCRKISETRGSTIAAELYLYHDSPQLYFSLLLSETKLPQHNQSLFHRTINTIVRMEF